MAKSKVAIVAEDSTANRELAMSHLRRHGFEVVPFRDGRDAWSYLSLRTEPVALVVSDYMMPYFTGADLLEKIRTSDVHGKTPFVMMTAVDDKNMMLQSVRHGISGFIVKPLTSDTVARVLERVEGSKSPKARILIVDDDPFFLQLTAEILLKQGYAVEKSGGAGEGLEKILSAAHGFDLVISDVHMPNGSGFEFLDSMHGAGVQIPIVLMSGDNVNEAERRASTRRMNVKFLQKNRVRDQLSVVVNELLSARAA